MFFTLLVAMFCSQIAMSRMDLNFVQRGMPYPHFSLDMATTGYNTLKLHQSSEQITPTAATNVLSIARLSSKLNVLNVNAIASQYQ